MDPGHEAVSKPESRSSISRDLPESEDETSSDSLVEEDLPRKFNSLILDEEITYEKLADKLGTTVEQLNEINGLHLDPWTLLAPGSELYVPAPRPLI
jgi:hypothetical protein